MIKRGHVMMSFILSMNRFRHILKNPGRKPGALIFFLL